MKRQKQEPYTTEAGDYLGEDIERPTKCMKLAKPALELNLSGYPISRLLLQSLSAVCANVVSLNLSCCNYVTDADLALLINFHSPNTNLRFLDLSYTQITDTGIAAITNKCPNLTSVNLTGCLEITDVSMSFLAQNCKKLQILIVSGCPRIGDIGVQLIAQEAKHHLRILDLNECSRISDKALMYLGHYCPALSCLRLKNTSISVPVLFKLLSRLQLSELNIQSLPITDSLLIVLARMQQTLRILDISFCSHVTINGLKHVIEKLEFLCELHVFGLAVPDVDLNTLKLSHISLSLSF